MKFFQSAQVTGIKPYSGEWIDGAFVINHSLTREDLTNPNVKPSFVIHLSGGHRVLLGWTTKGQQRQFYVKELEPYGTPNRWMLKVVRMRGKKWNKLTSEIKKGMENWFQSKPISVNFTAVVPPMINQIYPKLIAADIVSVQPMSFPASVEFLIKKNYGPKTSL